MDCRSLRVNWRTTDFILLIIVFTKYKKTIVVSQMLQTVNLVVVLVSMQAYITDI